MNSQNEKGYKDEEYEIVKELYDDYMDKYGRSSKK